MSLSPNRYLFSWFRYTGSKSRSITQDNIQGAFGLWGRFYNTAYWTGIRNRIRSGCS